MKIKKHKYGIGARLTFGNIEKMAMRRLGKQEDKKLGIVEVTLIVLMLVFVNVRPIPDTVPYSVELNILAFVVLGIISAVITLRRKAPRRRWIYASWAMGMLATFISAVPWVFYAIDEFTALEARNISLCSLFLWLLFVGCLLRLRYIRARSRATIAQMRLREKRRRRAEYIY